MDTRKIDWLNIGLIIFTLVLAFRMPFSLFLFSYAVLGPLHYMTEINWLDDRSYFSKSRYTPWLLGFFVLLICMGSFFAEGIKNKSFSWFRTGVEQSFAGGFFDLLAHQNINLAFLSFVAAVSLAAFRQWKFRILVFVIGIALAYAFRTSTLYLLLAGSMLPTFIHVCLFTGFFMLYGALKSGSRPGLIAVAVFILAHFAIAFWPLDVSRLFLDNADPVATRFTQSGFNSVIYQFGLTVGMITKGSVFLLNSELGIRMAIFLAFAYTYHYLNWFSKTSVIRWHQVSRKKLALAIGIWILSMLLYFWDYRSGLLALLFLSLLHVVFEFPLNYISITGIFSELWKRRPGTETSRLT